MKKLIFIAIAVVLVIAAGTFAVLSRGNAKIGGDQFDEGIKNVQIVEDEKVLRIEHGGGMYESSSYTIRKMDEDEKEYFGDRMINDGSLGKYRVEIMFGDMKGSKKLDEMYPLGTAHELERIPADSKAKFNIRIAYPFDHSTIIYIGSDEPINIKEKDSTRIGTAKGTIEIPIET